MPHNNFSLYNNVDVLELISINHRHKPIIADLPLNLNSDPSHKIAQFLRRNIKQALITWDLESNFIGKFFSISKHLAKELKRLIKKYKLLQDDSSENKKIKNLNFFKSLGIIYTTELRNNLYSSLYHTSHLWRLLIKYNVISTLRNLSEVEINLIALNEIREQREARSEVQLQQVHERLQQLDTEFQQFQRRAEQIIHGQSEQEPIELYQARIDLLPGSMPEAIEPEIPHLPTTFLPSKKKYSIISSPLESLKFVAISLDIEEGCEGISAFDFMLFDPITLESPAINGIPFVAYNAYDLEINKTLQSFADNKLTIHPLDKSRVQYTFAPWFTSNGKYIGPDYDKLIELKATMSVDQIASAVKCFYKSFKLINVEQYPPSWSVSYQLYSNPCATLKIEEHKDQLHYLFKDILEKASYYIYAYEDKDQRLKI